MVRVLEMNRLNNSVNGNPRYSVMFSDGSAAVTATDSQLGNDAPNFLGREVAVEMDEHGKIIGMTAVAGAE